MHQVLTQLNHYRSLSHSGLRVSPMCLGTMTFGTEWGWGSELEDCRRIFDAYAERGGNFIDTANKYTNGTSENFLGALIRDRREQFVLATKYSLNLDPKNPNSGGNHRRAMMRAVEDSLKRLQTDYIDLYWLHAWDYRTAIEDVMRAFDDLVQQGKILHIGISDTPAWIVSEGDAIAKLRGWTAVSAIQVHYNLIERTAESDLIPMARQHEMATLAWAPLASGVLSGKYNLKDLEDPSPEENSVGRKNMVKSQLNKRSLEIAEVVKEMAVDINRSPSQVALNWLLQQPGKPIPIIGARTIAQMEDNLGALDFMLTSEQIQTLNQASTFAMPFPRNFIAPEQGIGRPVIDGETVIEGGLEVHKQGHF